jgi:hypothetical protein
MEANGFLQGQDSVMPLGDTPLPVPSNMGFNHFSPSIYYRLGKFLDDDDLQWVRVLTVPMHIGLIGRSFVPYNLISAQESNVPLPTFQMAPRLTI